MIGLVNSIPPSSFGRSPVPRWPHWDTFRELQDDTRCIVSKKSIETAGALKKATGDEKRNEDLGTLERGVGEVLG
jgi:hypothetical protein